MCGLYCSSTYPDYWDRFRLIPEGNALLQFGIPCRLSLLPAFANSAYSHLAGAGNFVNPANLKPASDTPGGLSHRAGAALSFVPTSRGRQLRNTVSPLFYEVAGGLL